MPTENQNHSEDHDAIEKLHCQYVRNIDRLNDDLMKFQDAAYAMGRARGHSEGATVQLTLVSEKSPTNKQQVLAYFPDSNALLRTMMYVSPLGISTDERPYDGDSEYDEASDSTYWPSGWYQFRYDMSMWWDDGTPTAWAPMPVFLPPVLEAK